MSFNDTDVPGKPFITHDPEAVLDYAWDLAALIDAEDAIETATFVAPEGMAATLGLIAPDNKVFGWVSVIDRAAVTGKKVGITCHYTTTNGRTDERTLYFAIKDR